MSEKIEFLNEIITYVKRTHKNENSFYTHLTNTSKLVEIFAPEKQYLIDAALYHSIYETCYFKYGGLHPLATRENIKKIIGEKAESIVYLFCNLKERIKIIISDYFETELQKDLYILELANYIDNFPETFESNHYVKIILEKLKDNYDFAIDLEKVKTFYSQ